MENIDINQIQNSSKETNEKLIKVGAFLREARQGRNLTVDELSQSLRIAKEQIIALEDGKSDLLPEKVFVRAMVRRISEKLNLETDFILDELKGRDVSIKDLFEKQQINVDFFQLKKLIPYTTIFSGFLGLICSMIFISYVKNTTSTNNQENSSQLLQIKNTKEIFS